MLFVRAFYLFFVHVKLFGSRSLIKIYIQFFNRPFLTTITDDLEMKERKENSES